MSQGRFQLYTKVIDDDDGWFNNDDDVDDVYANVYLSPSSSYTGEYSYRGNHGNSRLTFTFKVACSVNYYGSNCATYCIAQSSTTSGYYTCATNGNRVCRQEWTGSQCTTRT